MIYWHIWQIVIYKIFMMLNFYQFLSFFLFAFLSHFVSTTIPIAHKKEQLKIYDGTNENL